MFSDFHSHMHQNMKKKIIKKCTTKRPDISQRPRGITPPYPNYHVLVKANKKSKARNNMQRV